METTRYQQRVLDAIRKLTEEKDFPPTVREIMDECGLKSTSTVQYHINNLLEKGLLERDPKMSRTVRIKEEKR